MSMRQKILRFFGAGLGIAGAALAFYYALTSPTNDGIWKPEYARLASAEISDQRISISNFRRARYDRDGTLAEISWDRREVDLATLSDVWFGISVFSDIGLAHTFLSFDFGNGDPVVVSVEARQRPDQHYDPVAGLLDRYQLIYVMADERDIVGVRTHRRGDEVFFQPLRLSNERAQALFLDMLGRANGLASKAEFYNTLTSNCTTSLLKDTALPSWRRYLDWRILFTAHSDSVAYEFGILDDRFSLDQLRSAALLDPATFEPDDRDFSTTIKSSFYDRLEAIIER